MIQKIFKYQMPICEKYSLQLPIRAEILRVDDVDGMFYLWAMVNPSAPLEQRNFEAYKTGQDIPNPEGLVYLGHCCIYIGMELCLYIHERVESCDTVNVQW